MVIWVCEASEVNNLTVLAVGPNHRDKDKDDVIMEVMLPFYGGYAAKIASSRSDPPKGSDKNVCLKGLLNVSTNH